MGQSMMSMYRIRQARWLCHIALMLAVTMFVTMFQDLPQALATASVFGRGYTGTAVAIELTVTENLFFYDVTDKAVRFNVSVTSAGQGDKLDGEVHVDVYEKPSTTGKPLHSFVITTGANGLGNLPSTELGNHIPNRVGRFEFRPWAHVKDGTPGHIRKTFGSAFVTVTPELPPLPPEVTGYAKDTEGDGGYPGPSLVDGTPITFDPLHGGLGECHPMRPYGPSAGDPVNLARGGEEYMPATSLRVYNSSGVDAYLQFAYYSAHVSIDDQQYSSPGLPAGWVHNYDVRITNEAGAADTWGPIFLRYPNGAQVRFTPDLVNDVPTGSFTPWNDHDKGSGFKLTGSAGVDGAWTALTVQWTDGTKWEFAPLSGDSDTYALASITNGKGKSISLTWDGSNRQLQKVTDDTSSHDLLTYGYSDSSKVTVTDYHGRKVVASITTPAPLTVPSLRAISQVCEATATETPARYTFGYEALTQGTATLNDRPLLNSITVPTATQAGSETATIAYADGGMLQSRTDARGITRAYDYQTISPTTKLATKIVVTVSQGGDTVQTWTKYCSEFKDTKTTDADDESVEETYASANAPNQPSKVRAKDGKETTYTYDTYGRILTVTEPCPGTTTGTITTTNAYDDTDFALGRLKSITRGSTKLVEYGYEEPSGLINSIKRPKPGTTDGTLVETEIVYNDLGDPLSISGPGNGTVDYVDTLYYYDGTPLSRQPREVYDNLGNCTNLTYDTRGNLRYVEDACGNTTELQYNIADQLTEIILPTTGVTNSGPANIEYVYLYPGGPKTAMNTYREGDATPFRTVSLSWGQEGEPTGQSGATEEATFNPDALYRLGQVTDGRSNTTEFAHNDPVGRLTGITTHEGNTTTFSNYDAAGRCQERTDGNNEVTQYAYNDAAGLRTGITYPNGGGTGVTFAHDSFGRVTQMTDGTGTTSYTYDSAGNVCTATVDYSGNPDPAAQAVSYEYNPDGSRKKMTLPDGQVITYTYDGAQRLRRLRATETNRTVIRETEWAYKDNGWVERQDQREIVVVNGTEVVTVVARTDYAYNERGQILGLTNSAMENGTLVQVSAYADISYDGAGNRTSIGITMRAPTFLGGTKSYSYDTKDRLTGESFASTVQNPPPPAGVNYNCTFGFDAADNLETRPDTGDTLAHNGDNEISGDAQFVYDGNGNPTTHRGHTLAFDRENRLTSYNNGNGVIFTAGYRGDNLRAWKTGATTTDRRYFLYDGTDVLARFAAGGALDTTVRSEYGVIAKGDVYYLYDPNGDVAHRLTAGTTAVNGTVISSESYRAWGEKRVGYTPAGNAYSPSSTDPYGYKGKYGYYTDAEQGLILCTYRYYQPKLGRWLTKDPIGHAGGVNLYVYCSGNPIGSADPLGLRTDLERQVIAAGAAYAAMCVELVRVNMNKDDVRLAQDAGAALATIAAAGFAIGEGGANPWADIALFAALVNQYGMVKRDLMEMWPAIANTYNITLGALRAWDHFTGNEE